MTRWKEIARLRFKGVRFTDRALDADSLGEVQRYLRLVEGTAKALWYADHPDRERLPAGFDEANHAYLRQLLRGSAVAVIEARVEPNSQAEFLDRDAEALTIAADFTHRVFSALSQRRPLPDQLPKNLVSEYAELGKTLSDNELLEIKAVGKPRFVTYRPDYRQRWKDFAPQPYEAKLDQVGEIVEADVRQKRFQIWTERNVSLQAPFRAEQESFVTTALKDHGVIRVHVTGRAEFSPEGKPLRFLEVSDLSITPRQGLLFDSQALSIEEEIEAIWKDVPDAEWAKLPSDLSVNLDHYLYGTPKK